MWTDSSQASGNSGVGSASSSARRVSMSSSAYAWRRRRSSSVRDAAPSRASPVVSIEPSVRHDRGGDRLSQLVPPRVGVTRGLPVPEPVVPGGHVAAASREEEALGSGARTAHGLAQRPRKVRIPEQRVTAHQRRMAGEAGNDREWGAVGAVDGDHADRVVDRTLRHDAVHGDAGGRARAPADARRREGAPGRVDGAGDGLGQQLDVPGKGRGVAQPGDTAAAGEARGAVVVRRVDQHRVWRNAGQHLDTLAHLGRQVGTREHEIERHDRDGSTAVVQHERLRDEGIVNPLRQARAGGPAAVRKAARRGDVGVRDAGPELGHRWSFLLLMIGWSARRTFRVVAS